MKKGIFVIFLLLISCRIDSSELFCSLKDKIILSNQFNELIAYIEDNFYSSNIEFNYFREYTYATLKIDGKPSNKISNIKKLNDLLNDVNQISNFDLHQIKKNKSSIIINGYNGDIAYSIVKTDKLNILMKESYSGYKYSSLYSNELFENNDKILFLVKDDIYLRINRIEYR